MPTTRADRVVLRDAGSSAGTSAVRRAAGRLTWLAMAAVVATSVTGLWVPGAYGDRESLTAMLQAWDAVMLLLAVPALAWAQAASRTGSTTGALVRAGVLGGALYTYCYHVLATGFTGALLLHAATLAVVLYAFALTLMAIDLRELPVPADLPTRVAAGCLALLAVSLAGMWVFVSVDAARTATLPAGSALVESPSLVHLGVVLDLVLLVPLLGLAAVLLVRRRPWGLVLAAVALVSGVLTQVQYLVALPAQVLADVPGARAFDPFEPLIVLVYAVPAVLLFRDLRRS